MMALYIYNSEEMSELAKLKSRVQQHCNSLKASDRQLIQLCNELDDITERVGQVTVGSTSLCDFSRSPVNESTITEMLYSCQVSL